MPQLLNLSAPKIQDCEKRLSSISAKSNVIDSDTLFTNHEVVFIMHHGEYYSLRRTRNDKLILTK